MSALLSQDDIEREFGVCRATVRKARNDGKLKGIAVGKYHGRTVFHFKRKDVEAWRKTLSVKRAGRKYRAWSEDEIEAALELRPTCTAAQVGEYLGRPEKGVFQIWFRYADTAFNPMTMRRIPFHVPRAAILIAKSCVGCGKLRDARYYRPVPDGWNPRCVICVRKSKQGYKCDTDRTRDIELLQEITLEQAFNEHRRYTPGEWDVLKDKEINEVEAAFKLNRSYLAVVAQRTKLGMYGSLPRLNLGDSHWVIDFPNAMKALQQHFIAIGKPVPEQDWDWNNTMEGTK